MADKTMPERITVHKICSSGAFPDNVRITETALGILLPSDIAEAEYVRADLAAGDASEPLELYQCRWIKIGKSLRDGKREWLIARVDFDEDDYGNEVLCFYDIWGNEYRKRDIDVVGSVIRPPADTTN